MPYALRASCVFVFRALFEVFETGPLSADECCECASKATKLMLQGPGLDSGARCQPSVAAGE